MTSQLENTTVICLSANEGVERVELTEPVDALRAVGADVIIVAPEPGEIDMFDHLDRAGSVPVDRTVAAVDPDEIDALLLPGGVANPDHLRTVPEAVELVRAVVEAGKPVAVICHGPWTLIEADVVRDRMLTSWPSLTTDLRNAGAEWLDQEVVTCQHGPGPIISSRKPDDLPAFCETFIEVLGHADASLRSDPADEGTRSEDDLVPAGSPAAGVVDPTLADPPEPAEPA